MIFWRCWTAVNLMESQFDYCIWFSLWQLSECWALFCCRSNGDISEELAALAEDLVSDFQKELEPIMANLNKAKATFDDIGGMRAMVCRYRTDQIASIAVVGAECIFFSDPSHCLCRAPGWEKGVWFFKWDMAAWRLGRNGRTEKEAREFKRTAGIGEKSWKSRRERPNA